MVKLVNAEDLESSVFGLVGSSPTGGIVTFMVGNSTVEYVAVNHVIGVRHPFHQLFFTIEIHSKGVLHISN